MATDPASVFGRYELRGTLGRGGFATVYRAYDPLLNREIALKTLLVHLAEDDDIRSRFVAESQRIAQLHHPNIVTVYDVGETDGRPFFTMELIEGHTLTRLIMEGGVSVEQAAQLMKGLCSAVDYLHDHGLVHRDIKPANIMIDQGDRVVLMDFGVARAVDQTQFTQAGMSIGTPTAMAPEQVQGRTTGPAADIYALGILIYQLLTGRPPFVGDTAYVLFAHAHEEPPPLRDMKDNLPESVYEAIDAALAKNPDDRPPRAAELAAALEGRPLGSGPISRQLDAAQLGFVPRAAAEARSGRYNTRSTDAPTIAQPTTGTQAAGPGPETHLLSTTAEAQAPAAKKFPVALVGGIAAAVVVVLAVVGFLATRGGGGSAKPSPTAAVTVVAPPATNAPTTAATGTTAATVAATQAATQAPVASASAVAPPSSTVPPPLAVTYTVASLVGLKGQGFADGPAASAEFSSPVALAMAPDGRMFVADFDNQRIRTLTADGAVGTLAGSGTVGFRDGPGNQAMFDDPSGLAVDGSGNVIVADRENQRVRKVAPDGSVSTVAGTGERGARNGAANQAQFNQPGAVAVDKSGNIFVADFGNNLIRQIDTSGNVTTYAGTGEKGWRDGPAGQAAFFSPGALALDSAGNLYVVDLDNARVRKIAPDRTVTTLAGSGQKGNVDGPGANAQFARPGGISIDKQGNIYIADTGNNKIRRVAPNGTVATLAGTGTPGKSDGNGNLAEFDGPSDVLADPNGNIYVADTENALIRKIAPVR